jgi:hypothetical protein
MNFAKLYILSPRLSNSAFANAGVLHELPSVVESDPVLDARLFPGGKIEGWVMVQAEQGGVGLMAVFEPL